MTRLFYALTLALGITLINAKAAHAEVCDETITRHYASNPDDPLVSAAYRDCTSVWRGTLRRSGVPARIMLETALTPPPNLVSEVRRGLELADDALIKLGSDANIGDRVKVILASVNYESADAYSSLVDDICYLVIAPRSHRLLPQPGAMGFIMSHELFHCVQAATFSGLNSNDNKWWGEGSAHWFAHLAQPTQVVEHYSQSANRFERESGRKPLREFDYSMWPFFAWYSQEKGNARAVMELLRSLPPGPHSDATIAGLLEPEEWYKFARDYSAYQISISHRVPVDPRPRANLPVTRIELPNAGDEQSYTFNRRTGALDRYKIVLGPGDWQLSTDAADPMFLSEYGPSGDPGTDWQEISQSAGSLSLSVDCEDQKSYALVGFGTRADIGRLTLTARKLADTCEISCANPPRGHDMCLNGIWRETTLVVPRYVRQALNEGLAQARRAQARGEITELQIPPPVVTFFPDTNAATVDLSGYAVMSGSGFTTRIEFDLSRGDATWGTSGNKLLICPQSVTTRGTMTLSGRGYSQTVPLRHDMRLDPGDGILFDYTCNGSTVTLRNAERDIDGRLER